MPENDINPLNMFSLEGLANELFSQSGLGQMVGPLLIPYLRPLIGMGIDKLSDSENNSIRPSDFMMLRGSTAKLLQRKYRSRGLKDMYGDATDRLISADNSRMAEGFFRGLGYSDIKAKVAAGSGLGSALTALTDFQSATKEGINTLSSTLYSRRGSMRVSPGGEAESYVSQAHSGRRLIKGLVDAYRGDEFGGMSFSEVSGIASRIMRTGALDTATETGGSEDSRLERIKARIKGFSGSLDKLKDVIDGDMSKVLDSMDKLFGGTTVAMANAKLDKITTSMQHAALLTGATGKDIAERGALAYSNIAAVGGTQGMGVRIGTQSLYYTQTDSDDARVSRSQLIKGVSEGLSSTVLRGENRHLAEAFVAWRRMRKSKNKKDVSFDTFMRGLGNNPLTNESLSAKTEEYIKQMYPGITSDKVSLVRASINRSDEVVDVEETENLSSAIMDRRVAEATTNRKKVLSEFYNKNKSGLSKRYKNAKEFIADVTGGDITATHQTMRDRLYNLTAKTGEGATAIYEFENAIETITSSDVSKTGINDARVAQQFIRKNEEAKRLRSQELVYNKLSANAQNVLRTVKKSGGSTTVGNVLSEMYKGDTTLAEMLAASFGVSVRDLNSISNTKEVDKALKLVQQVSSGRGSSLSGIRKIDGSPESAKDAKAKDEEYAVLRTKAEAVIRKKAAGEDVSEDEKKAYNSWIANTTFISESDEIFYRNLSEAQAARLVSDGGKNLKSELKDNERRYTLAKSMMKDAGIENHREFVSKITSAEESLRKARKISSARTQQILGMSDEQQGALTDSKDRSILELINKSKTAISGISGIDNSQRDELFKAASEMGLGTTQGALKLIIDLLTQIANKKW